jgi:Ni,Fe-hydrogenase I cytochrome b subunit
VLFIFRWSFKNSIMGVWQQIQEYFYIKKRDPNAPNTQWMRYMHGINRISIFMFLVGMIILIIKVFFIKHH